MVKVITYGTYDMLHYGHISLLERAKELGDYLIVGVTADDFDKMRGKINVQQSLMERIEAVRVTGLADEIIIEEYEGQKIDDIRRYKVDVFTVGSDWRGTFDYLEEYCNVKYLDRTLGVSSSELRAKKMQVKIGLVGNSPIIDKYLNECFYADGIEVVGICTDCKKLYNEVDYITNSYDEILEKVDAVYLFSYPDKHYHDIKKALEMGKHVLCESPITLTQEKYLELNRIAEKNSCVLMDAIKTSYATAYTRLLLLLKEGKIGRIYSVDSTCTSLSPAIENTWNSICEWGPTGMLPVFDILGTDFKEKSIVSFLDDNGNDLFTRISFVYEHSVATVKVGKGVKSEGNLIISGTEGYIYVPAPWWKTDYFELRYEDTRKNRRYFYQLDGEGIRNELVVFSKAVISNLRLSNVDSSISKTVCEVIEDFYNRKDFMSL